MPRYAKKRFDEGSNDLDLVPIMNMVMILIPLLLLGIVFIKTGVVNVSSPRNAQAAQEDDEEREEEERVPRVVVSISGDGFRVFDQTNMPEFAQYTAPISRCGGGDQGEAAQAGSPQAMAAQLPPTVCLQGDAAETAPLIEKLDYAGLYNQLVKIRLHDAWFDGFGKEGNSVVSILADPEVPFEVIIRTMDTARYFLAPPGQSPPEPTASAPVEQYQLGGASGAPTEEDLMNAEYLLIDGDQAMSRVELFPDPVLLLPRPSSTN